MTLRAHILRLLAVLVTLWLAAPVDAAAEAVWVQLAKKYNLGTWTAAFNAEQGQIPDGLQDEAGGSSRPKHLVWPVKGGRFGRGFGSGDKGQHMALDIVAPKGTPIKAAHYGVVVFAGERKGYGNTLVILHPGAWVTLYAHCSVLNVKPGMKVKTGQKIALVGSTGISRGPHLHWELRVKGQLTDPAPYVHPSIPHPPHVGPMPNKGYTVKKGDTLAKVAQKQGVDIEELCKINQLKPGSTLLAGWKIALPIKIKGKAFTKGEYVVQKGDNLGSIAVLYDVTIKDLMVLNGIDDPDKIHPGQKIKLPEGAYSGNAIAKKQQALSESFVWHEVGAGDTLFSLAKKYETTITAIANLNGIKDKDSLKIGQKLKVPAPPKKKKGKNGGKKGKNGGKGKVPETEG